MTEPNVLHKVVVVTRTLGTFEFDPEESIFIDSAPIIASELSFVVRSRNIEWIVFDTMFQYDRPEPDEPWRELPNWWEEEDGIERRGVCTLRASDIVAVNEIGQPTTSNELASD